jgi:DNA-binding NarL/FixJ family response regulator
MRRIVSLPSTTMGRRIGVVGDGATWRRGVAGILTDAGFDVVEIDHLQAWRPGRGGVAVAFRCRDLDAIPPAAAFIAEHPHIPLVVVVPVLGIAEYAAAVRCGAGGVVADDDEPATYGATVTAALADQFLVPATVMRALVARLPDSLDDAWLDEESLSLIRSLAAGSTVASIADEKGYSEREMFRMLKELYTALGVENRTQAIIWAARNGVLDEQNARS